MVKQPMLRRKCICGGQQQWLRDGAKMIDSAEDIESAASQRRTKTHKDTDNFFTVY
jgi:glycerol kinase